VKRPPSRRGTSLIEVLLCAALLVAALVPCLSGLGRQARASKDLEHRLEARAFASALVRVLQALPYGRLCRLEADLGDQELRRELRLPRPPAPLTAELAFEDVAGQDPRVLRKVVVTVRWTLAGEAGKDPRQQSLTVERVLVNRTHTLEYDGGLS